MAWCWLTSETSPSGSVSQRVAACPFPTGDRAYRASLRDINVDGGSTTAANPEQAEIYHFRWTAGRGNLGSLFWAVDRDWAGDCRQLESTIAN